MVRNRRVRARTTEVAGRGQRVLVGSWFEGKYCAQVTKLEVIDITPFTGGNILLLKCATT